MAMTMMMNKWAWAETRIWTVESREMIKTTTTKTEKVQTRNDSRISAAFLEWRAVKHLYIL